MSVYSDTIASRHVHGVTVPTAGDALVWDSTNSYWKAGSGKGILLVAASDAAQWEKDAASYQCDGTADNTEISSAISTLPSQGGIVALSSGTFTFAAGISFGTKPVALIGAGASSTVISMANSANATAITIGQSGSSLGGGTLRHLILKGNSANNSSGTGIRVYGVHDLYIEDISISDFKDDGMYINGDASGGTHTAAYIRLSHVQIGGVLGGCLRNGLVVGQYCDGLYLTNCTLNGNGTSGQDYAQLLAADGGSLVMIGGIVSGDRESGPNIWLHSYQQAYFVDVFNLSAGREAWRFTGTGGRATALVSVIGGESSSPDRYYVAHGGTSYPHISLGTTAAQTVPPPISNGSTALGGENVDSVHIYGVITSDDAERVFVNEASATADHNVVELCNVRMDGSGSNTASQIVLHGAHSLRRFNTWYVTESNVLSGTFAIDSTGAKSVTIAHGLTVTPAAKNCLLTIIENTAVDDWSSGYVKVTSTDATNVYCKVNIMVASATAGATAKLGLTVMA